MLYRWICLKLSLHTTTISYWCMHVCGIIYNSRRTGTVCESWKRLVSLYTTILLVWHYI